jgi:hypothetical protein
MRPIEAIPALFNEIIMNVIIRKRSNVAMKNHPSIFSCATKSERAIIQLVPVPGRDVPNQPHDGRLVSQQDHCAARALLHKRLRRSDLHQCQPHLQPLRLPRRHFSWAHVT